MDQEKIAMEERDVDSVTGCADDQQYASLFREDSMNTQKETAMQIERECPACGLKDHPHQTCAEANYTADYALERRESQAFRWLASIAPFDVYRVRESECSGDFIHINPNNGKVGRGKTFLEAVESAMLSESPNA